MIAANDSGPIATLTRWESVFKTTGARVTTTWPDWFASPEFRSPPRQLTAKTACLGWAPVTFTGDIRNKTSAEEACAIALDYEPGYARDDLSVIVERGATVDEALEVWAPFYGLVHTTYNHETSEKDSVGGKPIAPGPRFRVILPLSRPVTPAERLALWGWACDHARAAGHHIDTATRDISRFWYLPGARPGADYEVVDLTGALFDVDMVLAEISAAAPEPEARREAVPQVRRATGTDPRRAYVDAALDGAGRDIAEAGHGQRNDVLAKLAYGLGGFCASGWLQANDVRAELVAATERAGWDNPRLSEGTIDRQLAAGAKAPRQPPEPTARPARLAPRAAPAPRPSPAPAAAPMTDDEATDGEWTRHLQSGPSGVANSLGNAITVLSNHPKWMAALAFNAFADTVGLRSAPPFALDYAGKGRTYPDEVGDEDAARAATWLEREYKVRLGASTVAQAIAVAARQQSYHPVREYLEGLVWDGTPRLGSWLHDHLGVAVSAYASNVGTWWAVSAVARIFKPGCKADHVLIFEGDQGLCKSGALGVLGGAWFTDELPDLSDKDARQQLRGVWIVEMPELSTLGRSGIAVAKKFFAQSVDRYRPSYGTKARDYPRQCIFAGSVNEYEYLQDPTGNRRFWPVRVTRRCDLAALRLVRDQLWAEAVHLYGEGHVWWPATEAEEAACSAEQEERYQGDAWEHRISAYLSTGGEPVHPGMVLSHALGIKVEKWDRTSQTRVGQALARLGWIRGRRLQIDGERVSPWWPPDTAPSEQTMDRMAAVIERQRRTDMRTDDAGKNGANDDYV